MGGLFSAASATSTDGAVLTTVSCSKGGRWSVWLESAEAATQQRLFEIGAGNKTVVRVTISGVQTELEATLGMAGVGTAVLEFAVADELALLKAMEAPASMMTVDFRGSRYSFGMLDYSEVRAQMEGQCLASDVTQVEPKK
jgi:hypothetical protein